MKVKILTSAVLLSALFAPVAYAGAGMTCEEFFKRNGMGFTKGEHPSHAYKQTWSISWDGGPFQECVESQKIKGAKNCGGKLFSHNLDTVADKNMNPHRLSWRSTSSKRSCSNVGNDFILKI